MLFQPLHELGGKIVLFAQLQFKLFITLEMSLQKEHQDSRGWIKRNILLIEKYH